MCGDSPEHLHVILGKNRAPNRGPFCLKCKEKILHNERKTILQSFKKTAIKQISTV